MNADKQRLRDAKRKNRLRRLKNWKNGTTAAAERRRRIRATAKCYSALLKTAEKIGMELQNSLTRMYDVACEVARKTAEKISDCVGMITGIDWNAKEDEQKAEAPEDCDNDCEHCDYVTCPKEEEKT